jgi:hypothetical protein
MDAEHYRRKAEHCLTCAHEMTDPNARAALIELAAHWDQMAQATEEVVQQYQGIRQNQRVD